MPQTNENNPATTADAKRDTSPTRRNIPHGNTEAKTELFGGKTPRSTKSITSENDEMIETPRSKK